MKLFIIIASFNLLLKHSAVLAATCDPNISNCCPVSPGPVTIAATVTSIPSNAFYTCSTLNSITIPNSVTTLGTVLSSYALVLPPSQLVAV